MHYISTRGMGTGITVSAGQAIIQGLANDGGLYVPEVIPSIGKPLSVWIDMDYKQLANTILSEYLTDFSEDDLRDCIDKAYSGGFDDPLIAPLREFAGVHFLELFHGRTLAFKDMALSILPSLLRVSLKNCNENNESKKTIVLTATSGDTGKAALDAFAGAEGVSIVVFYPVDGVSAMQKKQMVTQEGDNVFVFGVNGNFDEAQNGVKRIFSNSELKRRMDEAGLRFSSANSINIGRLLPQIVYYFYAYKQMAQQKAVSVGEPVNFVVPTGNFGNILAGYYAKQMGLPIGRLICASNVNNVLYEFFTTGVYNRMREFHTTISPSMDILISSNFERLLYHMDASSNRINELMEALAANGRFQLPVADFMRDFYGVYASEEQTRAAIAAVAESGYVIDPHTAVAYHAGQCYIHDTGDATPQVILATASPYKFARDVLPVILDTPSKGKGEQIDANADDFDILRRLESCSGVPIPEALRLLETKKARHTIVCDARDMQTIIEEAVIFPA